MKVAIIGAGIVGSTAAYYLRKNEIEDVTIFDYGKGQATKAAAGIICPWFSKRRNKAWYRLASQGADFYQKLILNLSEDGFDTSFYRQNGVFLLKKDENKLSELYELAHQRRHISPMIGHLKRIDKQEANLSFAGIEGFSESLYASGAACVDGKKLCQTLLAAANYPLINKWVDLTLNKNFFRIDNQDFDTLILASGAWLKDILDPLDYDVDIRPQKGQLIDLTIDGLQSENFPVLMPEGELDIIPFEDGRISVGASHENDMGFDLSADSDILNQLQATASTYFPRLKEAQKRSCRIGTRAYTKDFSPFYGQVPDLANCYTASGLGSSGLTVGPLIGFELVSLLLNQDLQMDPKDYPVQDYIKQSKK
ncbi:FAD-binding oxidoreductase [Streptococcus didelphis]|uniref:FAD-binding oxidoreductase n=1 Tax=Streptococcus didelphis TaxID=102886 RepID=A0ABY9LH20_9STRE|nr:FAD-dependent oxidoreductase [Streptococcus didelphis]WMB28147.1 FAD-binding oxidoreductase [Streptococcus didelphis]WMB30069.1 FAD-binding oxidoreductase [Streptococcus didelphis]